MPDEMEIVKVLRCTATLGEKENCIGCRYLTVEKVDADLLEKLGIQLWESCDCNRVVIDASELLEKLLTE